MKFIVILIIACCYNLAVTQDSRFCFNITPEGPSQDRQINQGKPGKQGPPGPEGPQGLQGECSCDEGIVAELKQEIKQLKDKLNEEILTDQFKIDYCSLGIKDDRIKNRYMTSSSIRIPGSQPYHARLDNTERSGTIGCWIPRRNTIEDWIQIDLQQPTKIQGIITQGRPSNSYPDYTRSFQISYGNSTSNLNYIQSGKTNRTFTGNSDNTSYKLNVFANVLVARYIRVFPITYSGNMALRMELLTC